MQKITTFLWFDDKAEEAARFYVGVFANSKVLSVDGVSDEEHGVDGKVQVVQFQLEGQEFMGLNGGPIFKFTPAISLFVSCENQAEVDRLWDRLLEGGGEPSQCGWLTDRYGLSWQIIPRALMEYFGSPDKEAAQRAYQAMMQMSKIDIETIKRAHAGN